MNLKEILHTEEELFEKRFGGMILTQSKRDKQDRDNKWFSDSQKRILQAVVEQLDEMAFESDNGTKIELFINWDTAKTTLNEAINTYKEIL